MFPENVVPRKLGAKSQECICNQNVGQMVSTKAKLGNRETPRRFGLSIESIIVGDGIVRCTRGGGRGLSCNDHVAHDSECWDDWSTEWAFSLGDLNGLGGGHWGRHCFPSCARAHVRAHAVPRKAKHECHHTWMEINAVSAWGFQRGCVIWVND